MWYRYQNSIVEFICFLRKFWYIIWPSWPIKMTPTEQFKRLTSLNLWPWFDLVGTNLFLSKNQFWVQGVPMNHFWQVKQMSGGGDEKFWLIDRTKSQMPKWTLDAMGVTPYLINIHQYAKDSEHIVYKFQKIVYCWEVSDKKLVFHKLPVKIQRIQITLRFQEKMTK